MDKNLEKEIISFLSSILKESKKFQYKLIKFKNDYDVNFLVAPIFDILKDEDKNFQFILYCSDKTNLSIYCPTLYKIGDNDSAMYTLNAINNVNSKIAIGKIYLNNYNSSVISYINRILFNDFTKELTSNLLIEYFESFLAAAVEFYKQMKVTIYD